MEWMNIKFSLLEKTFRENAYPGQEQKEWLVKATKLDEDKIIVGLQKTHSFI